MSKTESHAFSIIFDESLSYQLDCLVYCKELSQGSNWGPVNAIGGSAVKGELRQANICAGTDQLYAQTCFTHTSRFLLWRGQRYGINRTLQSQL